MNKSNHPFGEKSFAWKGDRAGYKAIHCWINKRFGKPMVCEICGDIAAKRYEWAMTTKTLSRNRNDWKRVCCSCHRIIDTNSIPRGEKHYNAKLSIVDIDYIRKQSLTGISGKTLAEKFMVSRSCISRIITNKKWKHI